MNYESIIDELKKWNSEELFYRDYYLAKESGQSVDFLIANTDIAQQDKQYVLNPSTINTDLTEEVYFSAGRNVSIVKHPRYFPFFTHQHTFFEIIYVLSGHCQEITNDRTVELSEGDLCLLAPNVKHGIKVFDDSIVLNILIRRSTFMDIFLNTVRDKSQIALFFLGNLYEKNKIRYLLYHIPGDIVIRNYILDMYMEQVQLDRYSDRIICSLLTIFFTQLTRRHGDSVEAANNFRVKSEYGDKMLNYIMSNYQSVTLNEVAKHFHFSVPYCSKVIKQSSGMPFSDLITGIRLQQGENLLCHTQLSIADVSERIGYKNPETFIRSFHRMYHMSPGQYRKLAAH